MIAYYTHVAHASDRLSSLLVVHACGVVASER